MYLVVQSCPTLSDTMDSSPPGTSVHGDSLGKEYWSGLPCPLPGDFPNPGIESRCPALQADSLLSEPQVMPKNTGVGCRFLLQRIFPTQGSNLGLLHCRQTLYHWSPYSQQYRLYFSPQVLKLLLASFTCLFLPGSCWHWNL